MFRIIKLIKRLIEEYKTEEVCETLILSEEDREEIIKEAERDFWDEV